MPNNEEAGKFKETAYQTALTGSGNVQHLFGTDIGRFLVIKQQGRPAADVTFLGRLCRSQLRQLGC
jgi:hypothetical protein